MVYIFGREKHIHRLTSWLLRVRTISVLNPEAEDEVEKRIRTKEEKRRTKKEEEVRRKNEERRKKKEERKKCVEHVTLRLLWIRPSISFQLPTGKGRRVNSWKKKKNLDEEEEEKQENNT